MQSKNLENKVSDKITDDEKLLHTAICQSVSLFNRVALNDSTAIMAVDILRTALIDYADNKLNESRLKSSNIEKEENI